MTNQPVQVAIVVSDGLAGEGLMQDSMMAVLEARLVAPSALLGNIADFSHAPDTDQLIATTPDGFFELCRAGYTLWASKRNTNDA
jgi:hypothetical protein